MDLHTHCHASAQKQTDKICNASTRSCASLASAKSVHIPHAETPCGLQPVKSTMQLAKLHLNRIAPASDFKAK